MHTHVFIHICGTVELISARMARGTIRGYLRARMRLLILVTALLHARVRTSIRTCTFTCNRHMRCLHSPVVYTVYKYVACTLAFMRAGGWAGRRARPRARTLARVHACVHAAICSHRFLWGLYLGAPLILSFVVI